MRKKLLSLSLALLLALTACSGSQAEGTPAPSPDAAWTRSSRSKRRNTRGPGIR